jgi:hypothetical protein
MHAGSCEMGAVGDPCLVLFRSWDPVRSMLREMGAGPEPAGALHPSIELFLADGPPAARLAQAARLPC